MDLTMIGEIWPYPLGLSAFVQVTKPLIVFTILNRLRCSEYTAFQSATASGQVSEFAFILLGSRSFSFVANSLIYSGVFLDRMILSPIILSKFPL